MLSCDTNDTRCSCQTCTSILCVPYDHNDNLSEQTCPGLTNWNKMILPSCECPAGCAKKCLMLWSGPEFPYILCSGVRSVVFQKNLHGTFSPGFSGDRMFRNSLLVVAKTTVRRTVIGFCDAVHRVTYWSQSSIVPSNSLTRRSVPVAVIPWLSPKTCCNLSSRIWMKMVKHPEYSYLYSDIKM